MATHWPPRSPHEALISTPRGRQRFREMQTSPTPSPSRLRMSRSNPALAARYTDNEDAVMIDVDDVEDDDDEDEEMVQLKLQEIQARMKLKKIQNAKAQRRANSSMDARSNGGRPESASANNNNNNNSMQPPAGLPIQSRLAAARDRMEQQSNSVQIPASPVRRGRSESAPQPPQSPTRLMLGIDKGRKAADMSLKRAPTLRKVESERPSQNLNSQQSGYLRRSMTTSFSEDQPSSSSRRPVSFDGRASSFSQAEERRPLSFNERLACARNEEQERREKAQRIQKIRSNAFSIGREEMEEYKTKAVDVPEVPYKAPEYSRDDILSATGRSSSRPTTMSASSSFTQPSSTQVNSDNEPGFEPYSGLRLSKRILPHNVVTRAITGKKTYGLKDLLRQVKAPDWSLPDVESDVVVFAIVATKSEPRSHRSDGKPLQERGKYMVISLCDLQYEVELFLFNSGFDRFWKLTPGTILAILNPTIMAPKQGQQDTGRFSLVINSDEDTILEIGNARDLGYCKSIKKDGMLCKSWVNLRRTEYCEFHTNEAVTKSRQGRLELNNSFGFGDKYKQNSRYAKSEEAKRKEEEIRLRGQYDRSTGSHFFMNRTAAELIDGGGMADQAEKKEAIKRSLARKEKEAEIARKLGEVGGGAGRDYMSRAAGGLRASFSSTNSVPMSGSTSFSSATASTPMSSLSGHSQSNSTNDPLGFGGRPRYDLQALGLLRKKGEEQPKIDLGPIKRKRPESAQSSENSFSKSNSTSSATITPSNYTTNTKAPSLGWGSSLRDKLSRMKEGERLNLSHRPSNSSMRDSTPALTNSSSTTASTGLTPAINRLSTSARDFNFTNSSSNTQTNLPNRPSPAVRFSAAPNNSSGTTTTTNGPTTSHHHHHSSSLSSSRLLGVSASARLAAARAAAAAQAAAAADGHSQGSQPPVRKKTRFVTDKGIREAGRDSLGDKGFLMSAAQKNRRQVVLSEDDDDDLIVLK
ncbi:hypothetical protein GE21DRAFT_8707 [Neurospora crassa]|uniref:Uncharacterized protein n=2 Tax=Neurospora crassa TaxID=5141 RepID=Q7S6G8_NEUCR|nr:hypothetical protein NCU04738 [Neurospora crassa OR74A]EAA31137.2 hypothetical protein NCU04738 [Neurospora crassa OR74A]KHE83319.1 hypothetical protein GE21DRAFT_8707 [Neurospora crassa]|eukprot:XP_960373.2 hypothetical protein NCU04738 [Neurospora crassa OR74A]